MKGTSMDPKDLTPELLEQVKSCKTPADILSLAKKSGYDLSEKELDAISGGDDDWTAGIDNCNALGGVM